MNPLSFKALIDGQTIIELKDDKLSQLDLIKLDDGKFHVLYGDKSFEPKLISKDFSQRRYSMRLGCNTYQVDIKNELDDLIQSMGYTLGSSKISNSIHAPMPGILLEISVKPGEEVKQGDTILVLEAMKMENAILSPKDGLIKKILVQPGDTVDKNKLLVELE